MTPTGMASICGYMPQSDIFIGTLTVLEHLTFLVMSANTYLHEMIYL